MVAAVGHSPNQGRLAEGRSSSSTTAVRLPILLVWRTTA